ncbi:Zinc/iron permease [Melampsora americana]|nr:Zinc/iron permease [Melampsora americana]
MAAVDNSTSTLLAQPECGSSNESGGRLGLRVGAIFIILATSLLGTLFPILTRRSTLFVVPAAAYEFAKYFGSGVIIATAFIHLLAPANEALSSECLTGTWKVYPWPEAISMTSVFLLFLVEIIAFRVGTARLTRLGVRYHTHASSEPTHTDHSHTIGLGGDLRPENGGEDCGQSVLGKGSDEDVAAVATAQANATAQLISVAILEIGVVFHSAMFEGLGLGSRLSQLRLPERLRWLPLVSGIGYSFVTPLGLAIGLGVRNTYRPDSPTALMVSGTLDAFSSGVLLYTGLVELLAHDFIFNREMLIESSNGKMAFAIGSVLSGASIMALLGRWA